MLFKKFIMIFCFWIIVSNKITFAADLLSHKAFYLLNIKKIDIKSSLKGGKGQSILEMKKVCNGWDVNEDYVLVYELANKKNAKSFSSYKTYENLDGSQHSFQVNEKSDFNGENSFEGYVQKFKNKIIGLLINKNTKKLSFDNDILFPIEHLKLLINAAKNKEKNFTSKVFFGSNEEKLIKIVSAFIGKKRISKLNKNVSSLKQNIWPIKLAFYNIDTKQSKPDYEIKLEIDEDGIIHYYETDYGDFVIEANLEKLSYLDNLKCK
jgi:hypothetical protein